MKAPLYRFPVAALLAVMMVACATDPVRVADNPELKAQAAFAEYTIAEERAAALIQSPEVSDSVKATIQQAHARLNPIAEQIESQRKNIAKLRIQKPEDVPGAIEALNALLLEFQPKLTDFNSATQ